MTRQIPVQAFAERFLAQKVLQHSNHRCAFAVADGIKELADFSGVLDCLLDGVGVLQAVQAQRPVGVHIHELRPHLPLGEQPVDRLVAHPRCEALVQPQVVPPFHSDQISEPHMSHLMGDHLRHPLPSAGR